MTASVYQRLADAEYVLTRDEFTRAAGMLHKRSGIVLGEHKIDTAARVLGMRCTRLGLASATDYLGFLEQNPASPEWHDFINAFTVNHTAFFRENHHFGILAEFVRERGAPISVWSCAASTGEEAWSIAITLQETLPQAAAHASVWATDIDSAAIERAKKGVYTTERVGPVSDQLLKNYFLRGTGSKKGLVRVKPIIRDMVRFDVLNLLDSPWPVNEKFDAVFCRNTLIYFDKPTQIKVLERLAQQLKPGGLLFAGHSENFTYLTKSLRLRGQTVYELGN